MTTTKPDETILTLWTVYDHPTDFPQDYVARRFDVTSKGAAATGVFMASPDLEALRSAMALLGLSVIGRSKHDDPNIVETWI